MTPAVEEIIMHEKFNCIFMISSLVLVLLSILANSLDLYFNGSKANFGSANYFVGLACYCLLWVIIWGQLDE